jgi:heme-degrading monooxygenase HmoA
VLSLVSATIAPERQDEVRRVYAETVGQGLPPGIRETYLLVADDGTTAIATVWQSREALEAMRSLPEEPFARRVLREAGGDPVAQFFDVAAEARTDSG